MKKEVKKGSEITEKEMVIPSIVYNSLVGAIWAGISVFGVGIALSASEIKLGGLIIFSIATAGVLWLLYDTIHQNNKLQGKRSSLGMNMAIVGVITEAVIVMVYSINQVQGVEDTISNQLRWVIGGGILIISGVFFELFLIDVAIMNLARGFGSNTYRAVSWVTKWLIKKWYILLRIIFTLTGIVLIVGAIFSTPTSDDLERLIMVSVGTILIVAGNWEATKRIANKVTKWLIKKWYIILRTIFSIVGLVLIIGAIFSIPTSDDLERLIMVSVGAILIVAWNWEVVKEITISIAKWVNKRIIKNWYVILRTIFSIVGVVLIIGAIFSIPTNDDLERLIMAIVGTILIVAWNWEVVKRTTINAALWIKKRWRKITTIILLVVSGVVWLLPLNRDLKIICSVLSYTGAMGLNLARVKQILFEMGKGVVEFFKKVKLAIKDIIQNLAQILKALGNSGGVILLVTSFFMSDPYFKIYLFLIGVVLLLLANNEKVKHAFRNNKTQVSDLAGLIILYLSISSLVKIEPEWLAYSGFLVGGLLLLLGHTYFLERFAQEVFRMLYSSVQTIMELIQTTTFVILGVVFFIFAFSVIIDKPLFGLDLSEYDTMARTILGIALAFIGGFSFKFAQTRYYVEKGGQRR